jgi:hypothetical protein
MLKMGFKNLYLAVASLFIGGEMLAQTYQTDWVFDPKSGNIECKALSTASTELVMLDFVGKNKKQLPLFKQPKASKNAYKFPIRINSLPFTGELEGRDDKGRLAFQCLFWQGLPYGEFLSLSEKGDTQRIMLAKSQAQLDVERPKANPVPTEPREPRFPKPPLRKPVIYLYPTAATNVQVKIQNGKHQLTHTYPKYNPNTGWQVAAQPNGNLVDIHTKKEYYALFWEAENEEPFKLEEGFSVAGAETANFLDTKLAELGLNRREANEFIMYWLPQMENNPYNTIHFATESFNKRIPLDISPRPDALIRVFMVFQPTNEPVKIPAQTFETPKRTGFTVVEWGGTEQAKQAD